jgi:hypothetical protein
MCVLPTWWIARVMTDPTMRIGWSTADIVFALLVMWVPWLLLGGAMLRWGQSLASRGALVVGWIAVMMLEGGIASAGDGGGAAQGGINAGIYKLLLLSCQYAAAAIATAVAWGLDWFARSRARAGVDVGPRHGP